MDRVAWLAALVAAGALGGCMPSARYVQKDAVEGVVAIPERSNEWPTFYRAKADELIADHVGGDYEIAEEWSEKCGECCAPRCALKRATGDGIVDEPTEWRIRYRKVAK